jgi:hypothetical protein
MFRLLLGFIPLLIVLALQAVLRHGGGAVG